MSRIFSFLLALLITGCSPEFRNPPQDLYDYPLQVIVNANIELIGHPSYNQYLLKPTGSMEPFMTGGDIVIVDIGFPYDQLQKDDIIMYFPLWTKGPVAHRITQINYALGHTVKGDANWEAERGKYAVTRAIYSGKVVRVIGLKRK